MQERLIVLQESWCRRNLLTAKKCEAQTHDFSISSRTFAMIRCHWPILISHYQSRFWGKLHHLNKWVISHPKICRKQCESFFFMQKWHFNGLQVFKARYKVDFAASKFRTQHVLYNFHKKKGRWYNLLIMQLPFLWCLQCNQETFFLLHSRTRKHQNQNGRRTLEREKIASNFTHASFRKMGAQIPRNTFWGKKRDF